MEKQVRHTPKVLRYPLFLAGLVIIVFGGVAGELLKFTTNYFIVAGVVGFAFLLISVAIR